MRAVPSSGPLAMATVLACLAVSSAFAAEISKRTRAFNSSADTVWAAALDVAKQEFLLERTISKESKLRFRAGPLRRYRFEVALLSAGGRKTRVEIELRTNVYGMDKDAWRYGDRYFTLLTQRLNKSVKK